VISCVALRAQPPAIGQNGVVNEASRTPPTLAGGALARGARFSISGVRLADGGQPTVTLTQGRSSVNATVLSSTPLHIQALIPNNAPLGDVELHVRRGSETSTRFPIRVLRANIGLYSQSGLGWGPGKIHNLGKAETLNSIERPAHVSERISISATGAGTSPVKVFVGGVAARVVSVRPAPEPGNDEVVVEIPPAAAEGCFVPVYAQHEDLPPSNIVTMSIRRGPGPCDVPAGFPIPILTGSRVGAIVLSRLFGMSQNGRETWTDDDAVAAFAERASGPAITPLLMAPPPGTCTSYTGSSESSDSFPTALSAGLISQIGDRGLAVGSALELVNQQSESKRVIPATPGATGYYRAPLGSSTTRRRPLFLAPGTYWLKSPGGRDGGEFELTLKSAEPFQWTNRDAVDTVRRDRPLTLTWSPARHGQIIVIVAISVDALTTARGMVYCSTDAGPGHFTIPAQMLANLPAAGDIPGEPLHQLMVATLLGYPAPVRSSGLDNLAVISAFVNARVVAFR